MTFAGQDDERPGDEQPGDEPGDEQPRGEPGDEPEGIYYFDLSDPFDPAEEEEDPFASEDPTGHGVPDLTKPAQPTRPAPPAERAAPFRDVFEFALTGLPDASPPTGHTPPPPLTGEATAEATTEPTNVTFSSLASLLETEGRIAKRRERLAEVFDAARADAERPFLAIALRMPTSEWAAARFPVVERGIHAALHADDVLLADPDKLHLVAVLPGRGAEAARPLFTHLMSHLRARVPDAEAVGQAISVLAAPDGRPFQRAADFLAATFDRP